MEQEYQGFGDDGGQTDNKKKNLIIIASVIGVFILGFILFRVGSINIPLFNRFDILVKYPKVMGLSEGSPVVFKGMVIGEVSEVEFLTDGTVGARLVIMEKYENLLTMGSTYLIVENAYQMGSDEFFPKAVLIEAWDKRNLPLEDGMVVDGASSQWDYYTDIIGIIGRSGIDRLVNIGEITVSSEVLADSTISHIITVESGKWIPQNLLFRGIIPEEGGWTREEIQEESRNVIITSGTFQNLINAGWGNSDLVIETTNKFLWTEYSFTQTFEENDFQVGIETNQDISVDDFASLGAELLACLQDSERCGYDWDDTISVIISLLADQLSDLSALPLKNVPVSVDLYLPGRISDSNAELVDGDMVRWNLSGEKLNNGFVLHAESWRINILPVVLIPVVIAALIVFIVIYRKKRKTEELESFPSFE